MAKFCIFCGKPPQNKNKEHVLPQWLIKYTDRAHKVCEWGCATNAKITFSSLTFPACTACNEKFAKLEAEVKPIFIDLMESRPLNAQQINLLLDWFDKIRVGLWLSRLTLAKQVDRVGPKFYINDRVGTKDRVLIIERLKDVGQGISFAGVETGLFEEMPSAFALFVNDFVFINASELGLTSNKLGFPQLGKMAFVKDTDEQAISLNPGRHKTTHPVVSNVQASPTRTVIYQPMFRGVADFARMGVYNTPYVLNHSLDFANGVGGIFYQRNNNEIKYLSGDSKITLAPRAQDGSRLLGLIEETHHLQNYVLTSRVNINSAGVRGAMYWNNKIAENEFLAAQTRKAVVIKQNSGKSK